jgi:WD40 repeat protein
MLWDVSTGRLILRLGLRNLILSVAFAPDGKGLAVESQTLFGAAGGLDVWNLDEARRLRVLRGLLAPVSQVCYSRNGRFLAAVAQNWQVAIWDLEARRLLHVFEAPQGRFADSAALAFESEGGRFAFASGEGAKMWDVKTGAEIRSWDLQFGFMDQMVFQSANRLLLVRQESVNPLHPPLGPNNPEKTPLHPPLGPNNPEKTPRVCRIRDLLGQPFEHTNMIVI